MYIPRNPIPRRTFLYGTGVTLALPFLEAMLPAQTPPKTRFAGIFFPHGMAPGFWVPKTEGTNFEFPFVMEPLQSFRDRVVILSGLHARSAEPPPGVTGVRGKSTKWSQNPSDRAASVRASGCTRTLHA